MCDAGGIWYGPSGHQPRWSGEAKNGVEDNARLHELLFRLGKAFFVADELLGVWHAHHQVSEEERREVVKSEDREQLSTAV